MFETDKKASVMQVNRVRAMLNILARNEIIDNTPTFLIVELTRKCNLWCRMCRTPQWWKSLKEKGHYLGDIKPRVLDEVYRLAESAQTIYLNFFGEPFANRECCNIIKKIRTINREIAILLTTNFLLPGPEDIETLINQEVMAVNISVDSPHKERYEYFRMGARFERLLANLGALIRLKDRRGVQQPYINFSFVVMKPNIGDISDFIDFAVPYKPRWIIFHDFVPNSCSPSEFLLTDQDYLEYRNVFKEAREKAAAAGIVLFGSAVKRFGDHSGENVDPLPNDILSCNEPYRTMAIDADGTISPCCYFRGGSMGNIMDSGFDSAWNSEEYQKLRKSLMTKNHHPGCEVCLAGNQRIVW